MLSLQSLLILFAALAVYYVLPRKVRPYLLLVFNVAFWAMFSTWQMGLFLLAGVLSVYGAGMLMKRIDASAEPGKAAKRKRLVYLAALAINLGMLCYFKYSDFFVHNVSILARFAGIRIPYKPLSIVAPLGISFYTLQLISYLTDVYWGVAEPEGNVLHFLSFATFFPQLFTGPINRFGDLAPQLKEGKAFDYDEVCFGLQRMAWGVFKKLVIAERLGKYVTLVFAPESTYGGFCIWIATLMCVLWIYADFSGSMDIFIGIARSLGIRMAENFNVPFFSRTIQEFWQRWNITLGLWLKDYVMFPLQRSKAITRLGKSLRKKLGKKASQRICMYVCMFVLWMCMSLWHGGDWNFLIEGVWFWGVIVLGQLMEPLFVKCRKHIRTDCFGWHFFQSMRTLFIYAVGAFFFQAPGAGGALAMLKRAVQINNPHVLFDVNTFLTMAGWEPIDLAIVFIGLIVVVVVGILKYRNVDILKVLSGQNLAFRWLVYYALLFAIVLLGKYGSGYVAAEFIYAGF